MADKHGRPDSRANTTGNHQDLQFQFLLQEGDETLTGIVVYQIPGDFNNDGAVNTGDYLVWRKGLGTTYTQGDYDVCARPLRIRHLPAPPAAPALSAVPEPKSLIMLFFAAIDIFRPSSNADLTLSWRCRKRFTHFVNGVG